MKLHQTNICIVYYKPLHQQISVGDCGSLVGHQPHHWPTVPPLVVWWFLATLELRRQADRMALRRLERVLRDCYDSMLGSTAPA